MFNVVYLAVVVAVISIAITEAKLGKSIDFSPYKTKIAASIKALSAQQEIVLRSATPRVAKHAAALAAASASGEKSMFFVEKNQGSSTPGAILKARLDAEMASHPAKKAGVAKKSAKPFTLKNTNGIASGFVSLDVLTHSKEVIDRRMERGDVKKRCRVKLTPNQISMTYSLPLGCYDPFVGPDYSPDISVDDQQVATIPPSASPTLSPPEGLIYSHSRDCFPQADGAFEITDSAWNGISCDQGTGGSEVTQIIEHCDILPGKEFSDDDGEADLDDGSYKDDDDDDDDDNHLNFNFTGQYDDDDDKNTFHRYRKATCGDVQFSGIVKGSWTPSNAMACIESDFSQSRAMMSFPAGNCIESIDSDTGEWFSYSFRSCTASLSSPEEKYGDWNSATVDVGFFSGKGCRGKNLLTSSTELAGDIFGYSKKSRDINNGCNANLKNGNWGNVTEFFRFYCVGGASLA